VVASAQFWSVSSTHTLVVCRTQSATQHTHNSLGLWCRGLASGTELIPCLKVRKAVEHMYHGSQTRQTQCLQHASDQVRLECRDRNIWITTHVLVVGGPELEVGGIGVVVVDVRRNGRKLRATDTTAVAHLYQHTCGRSCSPTPSSASWGRAMQQSTLLPMIA
jgi:hypothetical protein